MTENKAIAFKLCSILARVENAIAYIKVDWVKGKGQRGRV
ncbi:hypothetical protein FDUTEX481_08859 [Tolypothrix sp. PCC 7601]|nr:hypothetical protein FDUTEX481_08859 [Tolypothrix sp. PCC 7601]